MMHWLESLCAAILLALIIIGLGYGWLMHVEAKSEGVVVQAWEHGE